MPIRRWLSAWLVLATLFAQLATAAYACPVSAAAGTESAAMPCDMPMSPGATAQQLDPDQPGLCMQHCQAASQTLDQGHSPTFPSPAAIPTLVVAQTTPAIADAAAWNTQDLRRSRAPPRDHSILHCCFRI